MRARGAAKTSISRSCGAATARVSRPAIWRSVFSHSDAPYVAIFDADFVPPPDFLRRTVPALVADNGLAFVQARWGHANRNANWLTRVQGLLLDSHFAVEQEARFRAGLPHFLQRQRRRVERAPPSNKAAAGPATR